GQAAKADRRAGAGGGGPPPRRGGGGGGGGVPKGLIMLRPCPSPASGGGDDVAPPVRTLYSRNLLRFAQALDQRGAQQKSARELGIFRGPAQLLVIPLAHRGVLFRQQPLVADCLRLRVLERDVAARALVAVEPLCARFPAQNLGELVRQVECVVHAAVHAHGPDRAVHVRAVAGEDGPADVEFFCHPLVHDIKAAGDDVERLSRG